jgi:CHASE3 domain sensor protein
MALSLLLAALAALALVGINEAGYRQSSIALAEIDAAQKVRSVLNQLLQNILDAETGQRGYLLTGEAAYRQPYDTPSSRSTATWRACASNTPAGRPRRPNWPSCRNTCCARCPRWT